MPDSRAEIRGDSAQTPPLLRGGVLVVGCGLMGTSLAAGLRRVWPDVHLVGVENHQAHRDALANMAVFDAVLEDLAELTGEAKHRFGLAVLAVPVAAATRLLPQVARHAEIVMDICSVKAPLCQAASHAGLDAVFAPTHPMTGKAAGGPRAADPRLWRGCTWLTLTGYPAVQQVLPVIQALGAQPVPVVSAEEHDVAMAAVSHGIHLASLSAMLASDRLAGACADSWRAWIGPGFRDVTRLSASPPGFWPDTLRANRQAVVAYLDHLTAVLQRWRQVLQEDDADGLAAQLEAAQEANRRWTRPANEQPTPS